VAWFLVDTTETGLLDGLPVHSLDQSVLKGALQAVWSAEEDLAEGIVREARAQAIPSPYGPACLARGPFAPIRNGRRFPSSCHALRISSRACVSGLPFNVQALIRRAWSMGWCPV
jgi:hypothetical protein